MLPCLTLNPGEWNVAVACGLFSLDVWSRGFLPAACHPQESVPVVLTFSAVSFGLLGRTWARRCSWGQRPPPSPMRHGAPWWACAVARARRAVPGARHDGRRSRVAGGARDRRSVFCPCFSVSLTGERCRIVWRWIGMGRTPDLRATLPSDRRPRRKEKGTETVRGAFLLGAAAGLSFRPLFLRDLPHLS